MKVILKIRESLCRDLFVKSSPELKNYLRIDSLSLSPLNLLNIGCFVLLKWRSHPKKGFFWSWTIWRILLFNWGRRKKIIKCNQTWNCREHSSFVTYLNLWARRGYWNEAGLWFLFF